jgi:hypothetical protein
MGAGFTELLNFTQILIRSCSMKRFILSSLSLLLVSGAIVPAVQAQSTSAIAPVLQAQATPAAPPENAETLGMAVTPVNLVFLAYQGFFESEGIPKFNALISGYQSGNVTAQKLVQVAIDMKRLAPTALSDRRYLSSVNHQLEALTMDSQN